MIKLESYVKYDKAHMMLPLQYILLQHAPHVI